MKRMLLLMALCMPLFGAAAQDETIEGVFDYDYSAEVFRLANVERRAWGKREFKEDDLLVEYGMVRAAAGLPPLDMVVEDIADELHLAEIAMGRVVPGEGEYYLCVDENQSTADAVLQRMDGLQQTIMDKRIVRLELIVLRANGKYHWLTVLNPKRERYISAPNKPSEEACTMFVSKVKGVPSLCKERQKLRL